MLNYSPCFDVDLGGIRGKREGSCYAKVGSSDGGSTQGSRLATGPSKFKAVLRIVLISFCH